MQINNLHEFLKSYFLTHNCDVTQKGHAQLSIALTEELDKVLMNRPFYWHYIKSIGKEGEPMDLSLITNPNEAEEENGDGEWIHFGSPRLQRIFAHLHENNKFTKLFQVIKTNQHTPLYPWLLINIKISYQGKHKKEEIFSIGLQLVNGSMKVDMMRLLEDEALDLTISDFCYPLSPIIKIKSGFLRIESVIDDYIKNQSHEWAADSLTALEEELTLLEHFYVQDDEESIKQQEKEKEEIIERYTPSITYEAINGGIIYLSEQFHHDHS